MLNQMHQVLDSVKVSTESYEEVETSLTVDNRGNHEVWVKNKDRLYGKDM